MAWLIALALIVAFILGAATGAALILKKIESLINNE